MFLNLLADFVVRMNVALRNRTNYVYVPYTKMNLQVLWLFLNHGCIRFFYIDVDPDSSALRIKVALKYSEGYPVIKEISLVSRPGLRTYWTLAELSQNFSRNNFQGFYLMSTPEGMCTSNELILLSTLNRRLSGEVLLKVVF